MNSQYRCETCKFADNNDESNKIFGLKYCSKCDLTIEPIFIDQICLTGCASHSDFQNQREKQCGTCKHKGTRACSHHGYDDVPISCSYKLGIYAEEAMKNLNGTFIDVWTPEHDKQVMKKVLDEVLEAICDGPPSDNGVESMDRICGILERIRKKGNTEDR